MEWPAAGQPEAYLHLQPILPRPIRWDLIRQQYAELVKYVAALRLGTADAEDILRRFTRANVQHPTYAAMAELGKVYKTLFLCEHLRLPELRREIQQGLNVVETWNSGDSVGVCGRLTLGAGAAPRGGPTRTLQPHAGRWPRRTGARRSASRSAARRRSNRQAPRWLGGRSG